MKTKKSNSKTEQKDPLRVLLFIALAMVTACSRNDCDPKACVTLIPTAEDVGSAKMYRSGTSYRFLSNGKDTLSFVASDVSYYEGWRDDGQQTDGCHDRYASLVNAKVRLTGTNNNRHMNFIISTWRRGGKSIDRLCASTLDKDSGSIFFIERENPSQHSVEEETDSLLLGQKTINGFSVTGKTYNDVYYVTNMSSPIYFRFYYHRDYGLLKLTTSTGETLEILR